MRNLAIAVALSLTVAGLTLAQEERETEALSGRLQPAQATELKLDLKAYGGEMTLKLLVAPGMSVKKGDIVAEVDAPDYEDTLARARENVVLNEMGVQAMQDAVANNEKSSKLQLEGAERNAKRTQEDLDHWFNRQRKDTIRDSELNLESFEFNIQDQEEELAQLEKLYQGNDLAKESQDIVLNRSKRRLKSSKERFEMAKDNHKRYVEVSIPRRDEDVRNSKAWADNELTRLKQEQTRGNLDLKSKLIRAERGLSDAKKYLADLEADKARFKLAAPHDGLVAAGAWGGNDGASQPVKIGDKVARGATLATVVNVSKLTVSVNVKVESRGKFAAGANVKVTVSEGTETASGKVTSIGFVVNRSGMVTALVDVDNAGSKLLPGQKVGIALPE
jgi:multidrug resistance efflux pump